MKPKYINGKVLRRQDIKLKYITGEQLLFDILEITKSDKWGAIATIKSHKDFMGGISKKSRKDMADAFKKGLNTPLKEENDYVRPDRESIRNELVLQLFLMEVYERESRSWYDAHSKSEILFGILHSHWKTNPQSITTVANTDTQFPLEIVMSELKAKNHYHNHRYDHIIKDNVKPRPLEQQRADLKKWRKEYLPEMIKIIKHVIKDNKIVYEE